MEFKQLQSYVEVARLESFTKAAETLFISQPTISTHIRQLEEELQTRLIIRTTKSITITPKGREFYNYAVNMLDLRDRMLKSCASEDRHIISIGASTIPSAYILPDLLPAFGRISPDTYFNIHQGDSQSVILGVKEDRYDIGLIGTTPDDEALEVIPFCRDRVILITPVNEYYLSLKDKKAPLTDLLKEPIILREEGSGTQKRAHEFLNEMGFTESSLNVTARINDPEAIKNLVAGGLGVSIISERAASSFVRSKRLLAFDLPESSSVRELCLIHNRDYIFRQDTLDFIRFLIKHYREDMD